MSPQLIGKTDGVLFTQDHQGQRRFWRDSFGLHIFWPYFADGSGGATMLSSFDPVTGALTENRVFDFGVLAMAVGEGGRIGAAMVKSTLDGVELGLLLLQMDDPSFEVMVPLSDGDSEVGVGWDGEAFVVEGFPKSVAIGQQYLARVLPDGTVLLPPTTTSYVPLGRTATNPTSGLSVSVAGWLGAAGIFSAHSRTGEVLANAAPFPLVGLDDQASPLGGAVEWSGDGALLAWSASAGFAGDNTTYVQAVDAHAAPMGVGLTFPPAKLGKNAQGQEVVLGYRWLAVEPLGSGVWVAGAQNSYLDEMLSDSTGSSLRVLVSSSQAEDWSDFRQLQSARWGDEVWAGFHESTWDGQNVFRIVRAGNGCSYAGLAQQ